MALAGQGLRDLAQALAVLAELLGGLVHGGDAWVEIQVDLEHPHLDGLGVELVLGHQLQQFAVAGHRDHAAPGREALAQLAAGGHTLAGLAVRQGVEELRQFVRLGQILRDLVEDERHVVER